MSELSRSQMCRGRCSCRRGRGYGLLAGLHGQAAPAGGPGRGPAGAAGRPLPHSRGPGHVRCCEPWPRRSAARTAGERLQTVLLWSHVSGPLFDSVAVLGRRCCVCRRLAQRWMRLQPDQGQRRRCSALRSCSSGARPSPQLRCGGSGCSQHNRRWLPASPQMPCMVAAALTPAPRGSVAATPYNTQPRAPCCWAALNSP